MQARLTQSDRQLLEHIHRLSSGTVPDLCAAVGVTATAVRQRLTRLEAWGFVGRTTVRTGRGRPHHSYNVTESGLQQLGDNFAELAVLLWREMQRIENAEVRHQVLSGLRAAMVDRYRLAVNGPTVADRMRQLQSALSAQGYGIEANEAPAAPQLPILREHSCPYYAISGEDASICDLEQSVFEDLLGTPVRLSSCCRDGHPCCEFEVG